ncbi:MAG: hypothetical protein Wins2KO_26390 [Winogradskyella sp.]|uniref:hypothetical protein n=1 Tax=Winogradskyella sp. TaxID=1883156 RepID=UPI0025E0E19A|nr:hypothetical protein [Winogradskyella sp.]NRB60164.1 hypothetical protein [Winogradskyella sp.]
MKILQLFQYAYLAIAVLFLYKGISEWNTEKGPYLSLFFAALAVFMFFFRKRYAKKFQDRNNQ